MKKIVKKTIKKSIAPINYKRSIILGFSIFALIFIFTLYLGKSFQVGPLSSLFATPASINWVGNSNKAIVCSSLSSQELCNKFSRNNSEGNPASCEWSAPITTQTENVGRACKTVDCQKGVQGCSFVKKPIYTCTIDTIRAQDLCINAGGAWGPTGKSTTTCDGTKYTSGQYVTTGSCKNIEK